MAPHSNPVLPSSPLLPLDPREALSRHLRDALHQRRPDSVTLRPVADDLGYCVEWQVEQGAPTPPPPSD